MLPSPCQSPPLVFQGSLAGLPCLEPGRPEVAFGDITSHRPSARGVIADSGATKGRVCARTLTPAATTYTSVKAVASTDIVAVATDISLANIAAHCPAPTFATVAAYCRVNDHVVATRS